MKVLSLGLFAPLAHRDYASLSGALVVSGIGMTVQSLGRVWLLQETTHSPLLIGLAAAATGLPVLVFGLFGGYIGDRYNRKVVTVLTETAAFTAALLLAVLAARGSVATWHIIALAFAQGSAFAISQPIKQTLITDLVPVNQQRNSLGLNALSGSFASVVGAATGGLVLTLAGTTAALFTGALVSALAVPLLLTMRADGPTPARISRPHMFAGLRDGIRYAFADPVIRWLMLITPVMLIGLSTRGVVYPGLVQDELRLGAGSLGVLEFAGAVGSVFGPLIFVAASPRLGDYRLLVGAGLVFGVTVVMMAYSPTLLVLAVFSGVTSCVGQVFGVTLWSAMQLRPEPAVRVHVVSLRFVVASTQHGGLIALGALAEAVGPRLSLASFAVVGMLLFLATLVIVPPRGWSHGGGR